MRFIQANFINNRIPLRNRATQLGGSHTLQAKGSGDVLMLEPNRLNLSGSVGSPLPTAVRQKMEAFFRADFDSVRIHVGPQAQAIGAHAFTSGNHIFFAPGQYAPDTAQGQQLLGHELTHVLQQRRGRVNGPAGGGLAIVNDRALEAEADHMGMRAAAFSMPQTTARIQAQRAARTGPQLHPPRPDSVAQMRPVLPPPQIMGPGVDNRYYYRKNNTVFAIERGKHYYWRPATRTWYLTSKSKAPTYNRFGVGVSGRGGFRAASFKGRHGSGASYAEHLLAPVGSKYVEALVVGAKKKRRTYVAAMRTATELEHPGHGTGSATEYAALHPAAPVIAGGYNWCHLIGHGGGGGDNAGNLVAASTHNNSEQLAIERVVYQFKNSGVAMRVDAELHVGSQHLARHLTYHVIVRNEIVFSRRMDAWRTDKPTFIELVAIDILVNSAISKALD